MASPHRPGTTKKVFTLTINDMEHPEVDTTLERFLAEGRRADGGAFAIPFRALNIQVWAEPETDMDYYYSQPRIGEFLASYGPQITHLRVPYVFFHTLGFHEIEDEETSVRDELSFYEGLPNLTHLTTRKLGNNAPTEQLSFLQRLHSLDIEWVHRNYYSNSNATAFLEECRNLKQLTLPTTFLPALAAYFETRRVHPGTLNLTVLPPPRGTRISNPYVRNEDGAQLLESSKMELRSEDGARLLEQLAAADGRILISSTLPVLILDEAAFLFRDQTDKLRGFGKCITSLSIFSSSLSRLELPNLRRLDIDPDSVSVESVEEVEEFCKKTEDPWWPKLRYIRIGNGSFFPEPDRSDIGRLLVGSGRVRPSVRELHFNLQLTFLSSEEALRNLPHLTTLTLGVREGSLEVFRNCMRSLPTTSPNIHTLDIMFKCRFEVEDVEGFAPLLQFPGKISLPYLILCHIL
jgi:hypothetical protein